VHVKSLKVSKGRTKGVISTSEILGETVVSGLGSIGLTSLGFIPLLD